MADKLQSYPVGRVLGKYPVMFEPKGLLGSAAQAGTSYAPNPRFIRQMVDLWSETLGIVQQENVGYYRNPDIIHAGGKRGGVGLGYYPMRKGGYAGVRGGFSW